jgi:hypothetical protein
VLFVPIECVMGAILEPTLMKFSIFGCQYNSNYHLELNIY